jgi:hypothetical protein
MNREGENPGEQNREDAKTTPAATATPEVQTGELKDEALGKVAGGNVSTVLTNIANMKHESLKAIAQNLRG